MTNQTLSCACGGVRLEVRGAPIITTECHCNSCREAGARLSVLPGVPEIVTANGGTPFVLYRKDRAEVTRGAEHLKAFRLKLDAKTRRVVASCCNTPAFLEFKGGHWMSIYHTLWPVGTMPAIEIRTMTGDTDGARLDDRIPSGARQTAGFYARLLIAWAAMGFRSPDVPVAGEIDA